jgi:hypothetical protein
MPTLTHILVATLALAVVLIRAAWRGWHQAPPTCEACGLFYCPGGADCYGRRENWTKPPRDDMAVWREACEGIDSKSGGR